MPRKSRIDAAGALHHIIARGIDRCEIFRDNTDRKNFLKGEFRQAVQEKLLSTIELFAPGERFPVG